MFLFFVLKREYLLSATELQNSCFLTDHESALSEV